jgi:hypothetical protein
MNIDCRGHTMNEDGVKQTLESDIRVWIRTSERIGKPEIIPVLFDNPFFTSRACHVCGEEPDFRTTDKGENFIAESECLYKDGFPPIEVNLEVPSGEILLFNDFRQCYEKEKNHIDVNSTLGIKLYTEHYAEQGLIIHFVGNSCPSIVQISNERLNIGWVDKEGDDTKIIGSICTDLWWYCAVDRVNFEKRIGKTTEQFEKEYHDKGYWPDIIRAKVTPGTYRTVGQYHLDNDKLYSFIERIK